MKDFILNHDLALRSLECLSLVSTVVVRNREKKLMFWCKARKVQNLVGNFQMIIVDELAPVFAALTECNAKGPGVVTRRVSYFSVNK